MADYIKEDEMDRADNNEVEYHGYAVLPHSKWLLLLDELPAKLAAELRAVSWREGNMTVVPRLTWLLVMALFDARTVRQ